MNRQSEVTATRARLLSVARAGWGGALLFVPAVALRLGGPDFATARAAGIARVLGARHLAQAAVTMLAPSPAVAGLGAVVDGLHAGGNLVVSAASPHWRRAAAVDAGITAAFAVAGWALARP
jgi:hypothetical protein